MRAKNLTPFCFAHTPTSTRPPKPQASCVVRAKLGLAQGAPMFALDDDIGLAQGVLRGETFAADDDERAGEVVYPGDFAPWKLHGEVMARGSAHAPRGEPTTELPIGIEVGGWKKALLAIGARTWTPGVLSDKPSAPERFTSMPIDLAHAYGGPGWTANPVGKGFGTSDLPNVEDVRERVTSRGERPKRPATFAPIPSTWPVRTCLLGRDYDGDYAKTRAPFYSADFDGSFFQCAQEDQQLDGFFRGDEAVVLTNLHKEHAVLRTSLPALRVRVFVLDRDDAIAEVVMRCDTVFFELDEGAAYVTWRGLANAKDSELRDLCFALIASEPLSEPPRPSAIYEEQLRAFARDPVGLDEERRKIEAKLGAKLAEALPPAPEDRPHALGALFTSKLGPSSDVFGERLGALIADASERTARATDAEGVPREAKVDVGGAVASALEAPSISTAAPSAGAARREASHALEAQIGEIEATRARLAAQGGSEQAIQALDRVLKGPSLDEARAEIEKNRAPRAEHLVPHADLAGRNLAGLDLAKASLDGANLDGADLSGANLNGASLRGASLRGALLLGARLVEADLSGADLGQAIAFDAKLDRAKLDHAKLDGTLLARASLDGADLRGSTCALQLVLLEASLAGARCDGARWARAVLVHAKLEGARFDDADLEACSFQNVLATRASFARARLERSTFLEARLDDADLRGARGARVAFFNAELARADLRRAVLPYARFVEATAEGARFFGADLRASLFQLAKLGGASFRFANLIDCDFRRAELSGTSFRDANLFGADFHLAFGANADFLGATLGQSTFQR